MRKHQLQRLQSMIPSGKPIKLLESESESQKDKTICKLCRRQYAKYICPTCNVPYCSLVCFRSPAHNQCSESFYKKEVESDICAGPKSIDERMKTLELLRKFEENTNDLSLGRDSDDDDGDDAHSDITQRFAGVDLDSLSSESIWSMLTSEEQERFTRAIKNPESQLAQDLLASEQLEKDIDEPWWKASLDSPNSHLRAGSEPEMLQLSFSMLKAKPSHNLLYNACAICVAYAFVTRHLGTSPLGKLDVGDPEYHEGRKLFAQLIPFATDRKSENMYETLSELTTNLWSRFDPGGMSNKLFSLLLQDASSLLTPFRVTELTSTSTSGDLDLSSHSHKTPLLVLSDLHAFYSKGAGNSNHIARKLLFYAAHIATTPTSSLEALSKETVIKAKQFEATNSENDRAR